MYYTQYVSGKMHCNMIYPMLHTTGYRKQDLDLDECILDLFVCLYSTDWFPMQRIAVHYITESK